MKLSQEQRMKLYESMKVQGIKCAGISGFTLLVTLEASDNTYIQYPCKGALIINEQGTDLSIIVATFRRMNEDGSLSVPVMCRNPKFTFDGTR